MLSKKSKTVIDIFVKCGTHLGCHPLRWESPAKDKLIVSKTTPWMWYIYSVLIVLYLSFIAYRLFESLFLFGEPIEKTVIQIFYWISYVYYVMNNSSYLFRRQELAEFITCFLAFDKHFQINPRVEAATAKVDRCVIMIALAAVGRLLFEGPCFLVFSNNRNFLFSIFRDYIEDPEDVIFYKLLFAGLESCLSVYTWTCSMFHTIMWVAFTNVVPVWSREMEYQMEKKYERPVDRVIYYRSVQILTTMFNNCYASFAFVGVKTTALIGLIICFYGTLRFYGKIQLVGYLALPASCLLGGIFIYVIFPRAAETSLVLLDTSNSWKFISRDVIKNARLSMGLQKPVKPKQQLDDTGKAENNEENGKVENVGDFENPEDIANKTKVASNNPALPVDVIRKCKINETFIRSCPFMGIKVGNFYVVGRGTTFTYFDLVINQTINLLMTF